MYGKQRVLAVVATLGILAVVGCSGSSSSSPPSGPPAGGSASASTPIASSSAVAKAKQQATACLQQTGTAGLLTSSGRSQLVTCVENIVTPAERGAFKNCMASAAVSDQVWTKAGREKFTGTSLETCLNTAAAATPSASLRTDVHRALTIRAQRRRPVRLGLNRVGVLVAGRLVTTAG